MRQLITNSTQNYSEITQLARVIEDVKQLTTPSLLAIGGVQQIGLKRLQPQDIEKFLLVHPVVPRGIEIRANRMTGRGYTISPKNRSQRAKRAAAEMATLLDCSGGTDLLNKWIQNTDAFGDGYFTLVPNKTNKKIVLLSQEHPVFFRIARELKKQTAKTRPDFDGNDFNDIDLFDFQYGAMKIDPETKKPAKYTQITYRDESRRIVVPTGKEIDANQVAHLVFDTWGDEVQGYSKIQYVFPIITYLLNIDEAAAESTYRAGFTQKKITTEIMNERELKQMARNVREINAKDAIILPKGVNMENLLPGTTQYPQIHDVLLTQLSIRLGVPKPILTLDGTSTNKATMDVLMRDMMRDLQADERKVHKAIEDQIFVPACQKLFGENFKDFPTFTFNPFSEDKDTLAARNFRISQTLSSVAGAVAQLMSQGFEDRAHQLLRFIDDVIPEKETQGLKQDIKNEPEKRIKPTETTPTITEESNRVGRPEGNDATSIRGKTTPPIKAPKDPQK